VTPSGVVFPRSGPATMADDGDALKFCSTCAFSQACLSEGMSKHALMDLHVLVEHVGPLHAGEHVFREGDPFTAIAAVRTGTVKTYHIDRDGHEQVLGFHLPGEVIGLNAIHDDRYPCNAVALDTVMLCRFSFPKIALLAQRLPNLQQHLFRLMSRDIGVASRPVAHQAARRGNPGHPAPGGAGPVRPARIEAPLHRLRSGAAAATGSRF